MAAAKADVPVLYYAFDLLYLDGYDLRKLPLEERKKTLASILITGDALRYSDHYEKQGKALFAMARAKGLEGILAKKRDSIYQERRSREWLKIKITHRLECVIGGYTEPEGSRAHFGSIVLGLYDKQGRLIHVGQAGSGFDQKSLDEVWKLLKKRETKKNPFYGEVEALRKVYWVKPELVAEIEYRGVDRRHECGQRAEAAGSGVPGVAGRQRSQRLCVRARKLSAGRCAPPASLHDLPCALSYIRGRSPVGARGYTSQFGAGSRKIFAQENKVNTFYKVEQLRLVFREVGAPSIGARIAATRLPSPHEGPR